jgi:hypothetical protein
LLFCLFGQDSRPLLSRSKGLSNDTGRPAAFGPKKQLALERFDELALERWTESLATMPRWENDHP